MFRQANTKACILKRITSIPKFQPKDLQMRISSKQVHIHEKKPKTKNIKKLMCCNRGEIAIRVFRAATELHVQTVAIYSYEDRLQLHRYKADEGYMLSKGQSPVGAYLNIPEIIKIAKEANVDAIHPGYGFLSENPTFAEACEKEGIIFIGPPKTVLDRMGSKTEAKTLAIKCGVPVIPGTSQPLNDLSEAREFVKQYGFPVILKAAFGGGGRGMRIVNREEDLEESFKSCVSEATSAFGNGAVFIERYLEKPRHIEVQILGDAKGNVIHLFERDCSVQRRHQKVVEIAPAVNLDPKIRDSVTRDAIKIAKAVGYQNAGTVEFLVDKQGRYYFIEVNPRIQVEHTVTEEVTGVDIVQAQIKIADGATLEEIGLVQETIQPRGYAIQCRVTTEDPTKDFTPDYGRLEVFRPGEGMGIRIDSASGMPGIVITPYYDSLLSKVTGRALTFEGACEKLIRSLLEFRIRGVKTNIPFLLNVLAHPKFIAGELDTSFISEHKELFEFQINRDRASKLLNYFGNFYVNGGKFVDPAIKEGNKPSPIIPIIPQVEETEIRGWRDVFLKKGPKAFAQAVREHKGVLLTDTTWRDAHQSLLATRLRTKDILSIVPATAASFQNLYSLECWGGATFDVALNFLKECPWDRLIKLRELVPNIPFQMLLRGANTVGYTSYPDNVVYDFCKTAKEAGIDIFRVFDSLNYMENLKLGIDAVAQAGGIIEAAICYTGDVSDPNQKKYTLDYYLDLARQLVDLGIHILAIKDMAGLLKPRAAKILISAIRKEFPHIPIHVHTHDTAGTGVASMLECAYSGADIVDVAIDAMAGLTSQPGMGAVIGALQGTEYDTGINLKKLQPINDYWEQVRTHYATYESGQKSAGADVFFHEMPGGQYTNLMFQSQALGLADRWPKIKKAYREANILLGDLIKVTPTSKVVGDLAQFMVQNNLSAEDVKKKAKELDFPSSVVEFFKGYIGVPYGGFPEPLRTDVLKGEKPIEGRPGEFLKPLDLDELGKNLKKKYPNIKLKPHDTLSAALYPKVFDEYMKFKEKFGDISVLETRHFLAPLQFGEEVYVEIERGKTLLVKLTAVGELDPKTGEREVFFELNGLPRSIKVPDDKAVVKKVVREKADENNPGSIGAPMPGGIVEIKVKEGQEVKDGDPVVVLSAMKMETIVRARMSGTVKRIAVKVNESVSAGDLLLLIE